MGVYDVCLWVSYFNTYEGQCLPLEFSSIDPIYKSLHNYGGTEILAFYL